MTDRRQGDQWSSLCVRQFWEKASRPMRAANSLGLALFFFFLLKATVSEDVDHFLRHFSNTGAVGIEDCTGCRVRSWLVSSSGSCTSLVRRERMVWLPRAATSFRLTLHFFLSLATILDALCVYSIHEVAWCLLITVDEGCSVFVLVPLTLYMLPWVDVMRISNVGAA